jgi:hypothetical protein
MFCAPGLVFGGIESVGSRFMFCAPGHVFGSTDNIGSRFHVSTPELVLGGTDGVGSRFHVLRSRTRFRWYRRRRVPFSCFALQDTFSAVQRASGRVFMFYAPGHVFGGTDGVWSRFHVFRARTRFRPYRRRQVPFLYFALQDTISAVRTASGPVFMFCVPGHDFGGTDGVVSRFLILRALTHFIWYRGRRLPFSCFALPDTFSTVPTTSGPVHMFCTPELVLGSTDDVGSHFHVLRSRTCF